MGRDLEHEYDMYEGVDVLTQREIEREREREEKGRLGRSTDKATTFLLHRQPRLKTTRTRRPDAALASAPLVHRDFSIPAP